MEASKGDQEAGSRRKGKCKWFNVAKGWGFVTPEDGGQDIFVHQSVIKMSGFRSLAEGEQVEMDTKLSDKGVEATVVTALGGSECHGARRKADSAAKKVKPRRIRCYNCGEIGGHIASKCTAGPQSKKCHQCKSEDHLVAECPQRPHKQDDGLLKAESEAKLESGPTEATVLPH